MKFNKLANTILKEYEEMDNMSYLQSIADRMFDIGSRISSGNTTPDDAEFLQGSAADIEAMISKLQGQ